MTTNTGTGGGSFTPSPTIIRIQQFNELLDRNLDMADERDHARDIARRLEQENAELIRRVRECVTAMEEGGLMTAAMMVHRIVLADIE